MNGKKDYRISLAISVIAAVLYFAGLTWFALTKEDPGAFLVLGGALFIFCVSRYLALRFKREATPHSGHHGTGRIARAITSYPRIYSGKSYDVIKLGDSEILVVPNERQRATLRSMITVFVSIYVFIVAVTVFQYGFDVGPSGCATGSAKESQCLGIPVVVTLLTVLAFVGSLLLNRFFVRRLRRRVSVDRGRKLISGIESKGIPIAENVQFVIVPTRSGVTNFLMNFAFKGHHGRILQDTYQLRAISEENRVLIEGSEKQELLDIAHALSDFLGARNQ